MDKKGKFRVEQFAHTLLHQVILKPALAHPFGENREVTLPSLFVDSPSSREAVRSSDVIQLSQWEDVCT
ncbi:hypothetical protein CEXT_746491 [Caerostris extrusa]|uniref:Uncharacterized protein n=1 Tax=Caerostris extrusa TaxID=172846 RepID=A0AAV4MF41_CAEEX|nr:hypothetical protein CEXT_746491 [Caerostris extrusa]